jgi:hypothetical protein
MVSDTTDETATARPYRQARAIRLQALIAEAGGTTALADLSGTPKSHISAMSSGAKGIGDTLADKFEQVMNKPRGWMDSTQQTSPSDLDWRTLAMLIADQCPDHVLREQLLLFCSRVDGEASRLRQKRQ